jgi:Transglycosylase SLT domain
MDISGIFNWSAPQAVSDAIKGAANATGASFEYLLATAQAESGMNPQASSPTSSARGLYQFIDQTWLSTLKQAGPSLGYGKYADAIVQTAPGHFEVPDPAMRRAVMALRDDPAANAAMAGALTKDNAAMLAGRLGREATNGELYIAHVLGSAGAARLTSLAVTNPGTAAAAVFPAAAEANRSIFYDHLGRPRNVADVYGVLVGRYDGARNPGVAAANPPVQRTARPSAPVGDPLALISTTATPAAATPAASTANEPARSAQTPLFTGLFSDRNAPVSQLVQDLWTPRAQGPADAPPSAASLVSPGGGTLFQPQPTSGSAPYRR